MTDKYSLENLERWIEDLKNNASDTCKKILLCNKVDLPHDQDQIQKGREIAENNNFMFCETSAKSGHNVDRAVKQICREIVKNRAASNLDCAGAPRKDALLQKGLARRGGVGCGCR